MKMGNGNGVEEFTLFFMNLLETLILEEPRFSFLRNNV